MDQERTIKGFNPNSIVTRISSSSTFSILIHFTKDDESFKKEFVFREGRMSNLEINFYKE
jgi:hypothetical protein